MLEREISDTLRRLSAQYPVVVVQGPRQSGKTTLCRELFPQKPYFSMENPDVRSRAKGDPNGFFNSIPEGAVLDEIQRAPELLSYIQQIVDEKKQAAMFVLTGSSNMLLMDSVTQTLAGRTALFKLLPFSIGETKQIEWLDSAPKRILYGGYPRLIAERLDHTFFYENYTETYVERDVRQLLNIRNSALFQKFLRLCAGRIGNIFDAASISNDCGISVKTVGEWLSILEASFICFRLQPYYENRSKRLIKSPKIYFYDTGLACGLLGISDENQLSRDPLYGPLFENFVILERMKRSFNSAEKTDFYFYRTSNGTEIDLLEQQGRFVRPIEIKSAATFSGYFAKSFANFMETYSDIAKEPVIFYDGREEFEYKSITVRNWAGC